MNTRSTALRNTLFSSVGIYTEYFLGMFASILVARFLGPTDFGVYGLLTWLVALGVAIPNSGVNTAAIKFIAELRGAGQPELIQTLIRYLRKILYWLLLPVLLAGVALFVFAGEQLVPGLASAGFVAVLAAVALRVPYIFNISLAKGFEDFRATAIVAIVASPLNLAMILVASLLHAPIEGYLLVLALSSAMFWYGSHRPLRRLLGPASVPLALPPVLHDRVRRHVRIVAVTVAIGFLTASEVEVLFLNLYHDSAAAGQFKVAIQLATGAALLVPGVFSAVLLPMMASSLRQGADIAAARYRVVTSYLVLLAAPVVAYGMVFAAPLIDLLFGSRYAPAVPAFAVCLFARAVGTCTSGASSYLVSADRQGALLVLTIASAVLKIGLGALLVIHYGLYGAVAASVAVTLFGSMSTMALAIRVTRTQPNWNRIARAVLAAVLAAGIAWPLQLYLAPLPVLLLGFGVLSASYLLLTVLLGCWTRADLEHFQQMHQRFAGGRIPGIAPLLGWAALRAEGRA